MQKIVIPDVKKPKINQGIMLDGSLLNNSRPIIKPIEAEEKPQIKIENTIDVKDETLNEIEIPEEPQPEKIEIEENIEAPEEPKRGRGRPRKNPIPTEEQEQKPKRGRGRPRKNPVPEENEEKTSNKTQDVDLFDMTAEDDEPQEEVDLFNLDNDEEKKENNETEVDLFNLDSNDSSNKEDVEHDDLFDMSTNQETKEQTVPVTQNISTNQTQTIQRPIQTVANQVPQYNYPEKASYANVNSNFNTLLTGDKKIVAFVGTTKNGTSFVVNNTAEMLASIGINTAILDMTKTKNAYYIYTNNEENLRNIAKQCMSGLERGATEGLKIKKNLTVYTEMPGEEKPYNIDAILSTLVKGYSAILIDTDFDTDPEIFAKVQEIYLVQSMDVLTIQPLTAFLRNLKSKDILQPEKLKIIINKSEKVRSLSIKTLIGGMSCYNAPNMSYMTELFNKDNIRYCEIPFETQNYVKYLDSLVNCSISLNGYTKQFMQSLREVASMVYPLIGRQTYSSTGMGRDPFSSEVNSTLDKMKRNY